MVRHPEPFATPPCFLTGALTLYYVILNSLLHCYIIFKTSYQNVISYLRIIPYTIPRTQHKLHPVNNPSTPSCGTQPDGARASRTHATLKVTDGFVNGTSIWHLPTERLVHGVESGYLWGVGSRWEAKPF